MPAKNVIKQYLENAYYHLYNRGVEKRKIFLDDQDYKTFLFYLKLYLSPPELDPSKIQPENKPELFKEIKFLTFCLMPNHFHFLLFQTSKNGIEKFMRRLGTKYSIYFNKKYKRVGPLFQGAYKAVLIKTDDQLLHLSRYIHLNPVKESPLQRRLLCRVYSSYGTYLGKQKLDWLHPEEILSFFKTAQKTSLKDILSYQSFVEDYSPSSEEIKERLGNLILE